MSTAQLYGITIDYSRDNQLSEFGLDLLKQFYMKPDENSPQEAFARASAAYAAGDLAFAQRIYDYSSKGWFMFSTPVLSNAIKPGSTWKGLPISCYGGYVDDSVDGLIEHSAEIRRLSVKGGGTAGHWSNVRSVSDKAPGPIPFLRTMDADMLAYSQGTTRRGSYAAYLDISHPEIVEFINIRTPTGGDPGRKCFNIHNAVNVTDDFMRALADDADFKLVDPHDKTVRDVVPARKLWQQILETRAKTGEPYILFTDTANRALPEALKEKGLKINGSNLCIEIMLPSNEERTFVCCLLSVVCDYFDEWKNTQMIQDLIHLLDNILQVFIDNAPVELKRAIYSATHERALGLGVMGFHSYLQSQNVPFESAMAKFINFDIFKHINSEAIKATEQLAVERGEYLDGIGTGRRNSHLIAIAPNANSSIIAGTSPSIEPIKSNAYTHRTRAGAHLVTNRHLATLLAKRITDTTELDKIWSSIITNNGSVQHLDCLDEWEKSVFKTAFEIDQEWVVDLAADRQPYICQGQSLNLFFPAGSDRSYVNKVHLQAWKKGIKGLYYYRTSTGFTADKVSHAQERVPLKDFLTQAEDCLACQA